VTTRNPLGHDYLDHSCSNRRVDKESGRFLKKAAQKLLAQLGLSPCRWQRPWPRVNKVFFASFCSQKEAFPFPWSI
jgi:hypothetical protein